MMIQVKTYRPFRRFVLIRFRFPLLSACLFMVMLFGAAIWMAKTCEKENQLKRSRVKYDRSMHSFEELLRIKEAKRCFRSKNKGIYDNLQLLDDILEAEKRPEPGNAIFFHETSCIQNGVVLLNARQACAIESAAKWNPNRDIFVIFTSKVGFPEYFDSPIMNALQSYPNIHLRNVDLETYPAETPMEQWLKSDQLFLSQYLNSHTSDFLRYASMFKFGGIYLDLDVVVQRDFNSLPPNFAAAESVHFTAIGAIGFEADGNGHEIAELCTEEFTKNFIGSNWGHNGPGVLTRVLKRICQVEYTFDMTPAKCWGFKVFPQNAFYAIRSKSWQMFFNPNATQETLRMTNDSIVVHVWNKRSSNQQIRKRRKKSAYEIIASKNCPNVYQASGDDF